MISVGILIGIIEDKIANDLTSNKTPKEHLEDIKNAVKNYKNNLKYQVIITFMDANKLSLKELLETNNGFECVEGVINYEIKNGFLILTKDDGDIKYFNTDIIEQFNINSVFEEVNSNDSMCSN